MAKTFTVKPGTRFFACQNPLKQGGSRRGLPKSFLNRFIQVYVSELNQYDLLLILRERFTRLPMDLLEKMVDFNMRIVREIEQYNLGNKGAPWEYNLRDMVRWCEAVIYRYEEDTSEKKEYKPENLVGLIYCDRMRTKEDREKMGRIFSEVFKVDVCGDTSLFYVNRNRILFGDVGIDRNQSVCNEHVLVQDTECLVLRKQLPVLRNLCYCVNLNWMAILVSNTLFSFKRICFYKE